jgi:glucosamine-phosphate N-acetyltransferase|tara:strand:- start:15816 stop:16238 length:423 start_codon:yes stop_codon:yes gene_type:complete
MNIHIKKMNIHYIKEVITLLHKNLSEYNPPVNEYNEIWDIFSSQSNVFAVVAIIEEKVVGYGALLIEIKIRGGKAGHIEDIVTHENFLKMGIGKLIQEALYLKALENGCHKIALQCREHNIDFYKKCNYEISGVGMQKFI